MNYDISYEDVLLAYYDCRKHKRRTINLLEFEINFEEKCYDLYIELKTGNYLIGKSIVFIITRPKIREVFAADFRDRIVHHLLIKKLMPLFEEVFIKDSYSCRIGKGTLYGVKRLRELIKLASNNYTKDVYVFKGDFKNFFMSIDKRILWGMLKYFIKKNYKYSDIDLVLWLTKIIVFHCPLNNCIYKGSICLKYLLEPCKSLFYLDEFHGLPIGNLTSQVFANFYLHLFDALMVQVFIYYGRYVDDFYIIVSSKIFVLSRINLIKKYLKTYLNITLHPNKMYLQHYSKGVMFIGSIVKLNRIYLGNNTVYKFKICLENFNKICKHTEKFHKHFQAVVNSYLGFLKHTNSFAIRYNLLNITNYELGSLYKVDKKLLKITRI